MVVLTVSILSSMERNYLNRKEKLMGLKPPKVFGTTHVAVKDGVGDACTIAPLTLSTWNSH